VSANSEESMNLPEFRSGPLLTGAALVGAGTMVARAKTAAAAGAATWRNGASADVNS
jgi:hypothetical protein